ncbi:15219_t:CDS:2 [Dentiscutata heterogama]|uniref:15219_t:CDS:1 n=1 Tax=Dentiscutata heterogama TaxID=1316150 RepID=A0ACA9K5B8_9GLOM|nr:15219_t:CDS:2 [Dentiscutata heterogama]
MTTSEKVRWPCLLLSEYGILKLRCLELEGIHSGIFLSHEKCEDEFYFQWKPSWSASYISVKSAVTEYGRCLKLKRIHSGIFLFTRNARMNSISSGNRSGLRVIPCVRYDELKVFNFINEADNENGWFTTDKGTE